jgi:16S rRNA (uracil1498-N3)-methyltransferase
MRSTRLYVDAPLTVDSVHQLAPETCHYLLRVLRYRSGRPLIVFNGSGGEYDARIERIERNAVFLHLGEFRPVNRESRLTLTLAQGVSRGERMDYTIQKAVELGVHSIQPLLTERAVVRLESSRAERRVAHWQSVAIHACEQCGRDCIPSVSSPRGYSEWLEDQAEAGMKLRMDPLGPSHLSDQTYDRGSITLLVGPEGGLSDAENVLADKAGYVGFRLGPRILRTETAAVAALTAIQLRWGDLDRR